MFFVLTSYSIPYTKLYEKTSEGVRAVFIVMARRLPSGLKLCMDTGAQPWISVGAANAPDDWHALISYLAAPAEFDDDAGRNNFV